MPRRLTDAEIEQLLGADVPANLATLDLEGYPHVTPLWFLWTPGAIVMTSVNDKPHVRRLRHEPRAGVCVHVEEAERDDGERPNRQVRIFGDAEVTDDDGTWTRAITLKYVHGPAAESTARRRAAQSRVVIRVPTDGMVAVASV